MSRASQWKKIFGYSEKPKFPVQVGDKAEEMTDTQAYRFNELSESGAQDQKTDNDNPLEQSRYSLEEAAFRLMIGEADVLQRAASGSINLYANAAGLAGRWRRLDGSGDTIESSLRTLRSGYLALTALSCKELALYNGTNVLVFEFPDLADPSTLNLDGETLQELSAWGSEKKCFCVSEPQWVDHAGIVLLAPLDAGSA